MKKTNLLNVNVNGNKKLVNNDKVRYIIWNLPAVKTCPFRTIHCEDGCYALKAERMYPSVTPSREKNYNDSLKDDFSVRMIETIAYYRNSKAFKNKLIIVRIHESGDFYSEEYAKKWVEVINYFRNDSTIKFLCYTKSLPYFNDVNVSSMKNLCFLASVWDDTTEAMMDIIKTKNYRVYTAVESFENTSYSHCDCKDCAHCMKCCNNNVKAIACEIH